MVSPFTFLFISLFGLIYSTIIYPDRIHLDPEKGQVGTIVRSLCKLKELKVSKYWSLISLSSGRCREVCARDPDCASIVCSPYGDAFKVIGIHAIGNAVLDFSNGRRSFCKFLGKKNRFTLNSRVDSDPEKNSFVF